MKLRNILVSSSLDAYLVSLPDRSYDTSSVFASDRLFGKYVAISHFAHLLPSQNHLKRFFWGDGGVIWSFFWFRHFRHLFLIWHFKTEQKQRLWHKDRVKQKSKKEEAVNNEERSAEKRRGEEGRGGNRLDVWRLRGFLTFISQSWQSGWSWKRRKAKDGEMGIYSVLALVCFW